MRIAKEDRKNIKKGQFGTNEFNMTGVIFQFFITIIVIIVGIIGLIKGGIMLDITKIILGLDFLVMAYNNNRVYNRKSFTLIYALVAIICIVLGIIGIIGD